MREILFRGKRKDNGEWIEGYPVKLGRESFSDPERYGICNKAIPLGGSGVCYNLKIDEVVPETVGQFTGLIDENGRHIFEGDIVDVVYDIAYVGVAAERIGLFVVVFDDGCFMKQKKDGGLFHFIPSDKCKVVGNIHDPDFYSDSDYIPICHYTYNDGYAPCETDENELEVEDYDE